MKAFGWVDARSVDEAAGEARGGALVKAGGVDLMDRLKEGLDAPARLVNLRSVPGLDRVEEGEGGVAIGPLVTLSALATHPRLRERYPALADAAGHAATPQIRNQATAGGNLLQRPRCWYFRSVEFHCLRKGGELCFAQGGQNPYHAVLDNHICAIVHPSALATALLALGARVALTGPGGVRRELDVAQLFLSPEVDVTREHVLGPGEILTQILVPAPEEGARSAYVKLGERESADWPVAEAAVALTLRSGTCTRASVVLGAAAPTPWRARVAEAMLTGRAVTAESAAAALRAELARATPLAMNGYKVPLLEVAGRRALLAAAGIAG